jgi:hypothetical protein
MLDREIEQRWQAVKESYPDSVVFHELHGLYIVRGGDMETLTKEFGIRSASPWYGFPEEQTTCYMQQLVERGYSVVVSNGHGASPVRQTAGQNGDIRRQRAKGKYLAIEPRLLFDHSTIDAVATDRWVKRHGYDALLETLESCLVDSGEGSFPEYGEVFVYQVGDWYELDHELTTMLDAHILLLAKAAIATGCKMPCKLVEPRARRERKRRQTAKVEAPSIPIGQMRFEGL